MDWNLDSNPVKFGFVEYSLSQKLPDAFRGIKTLAVELYFIGGVPDLFRNCPPQG
jgi:hypothetical protein